MPFLFVVLRVQIQATVRSPYSPRGFEFPIMSLLDGVLAEMTVERVLGSGSNGVVLLCELPGPGEDVLGIPRACPLAVSCLDVHVCARSHGLQFIYINTLKRMHLAISRPLIPRNLPRVYPILRDCTRLVRAQRDTHA